VCSSEDVRARHLGWVMLAAALGAFVHYGGLRALVDVARMFVGTPHERYSARLRLGLAGDRAMAQAWLSSAESSLRDPRPVRVPLRDELTFRATFPQASVIVVPLRRGQRLLAETEIDEPRGGPTPFIDLFIRDDAALRRVESAAPHQSELAMDLRADGEYVLRVQPELGRDVRVTLTLGAKPSLRLPVEGAVPAHIRSAFGDPREGGRRSHAGVDIFARRGTKVLAAGDGIVSSVGVNRLGGNVVWVLRPSHGETHYYAHLDTQLVRAGTRVRSGDVIGTVGNTGNARGTAPHLHFGIYASGGAVDPLPYVAPFDAGRSNFRAGARSKLVQSPHPSQFDQRSAVDAAIAGLATAR
jgi:peptidoglycan LD-endopeptidase LytH